MHSRFTSIVALAFVAFTTFTFAAPVLDKRDDNGLYENDPWRLRDITTFTPVANSQSSSTFTFKISDSNRGLEFDTTCHHEVAPGSTETTLADSKWRRCDNVAVRYKFDGSKIDISRYYKSSAVAGDTNMDTVTCYGSNATSFSTVSNYQGSVQHQPYLEIYCTSMVA